MEAELYCMMYFVSNMTYWAVFSSPELKMAQYSLNAHIDPVLLRWGMWPIGPLVWLPLAVMYTDKNLKIYLTLCFEANTGDVGGVDMEQGVKGGPSSSHHSQANGHAFILIEHVQCQPSLLVIYWLCQFCLLLWLLVIFICHLWSLLCVNKLNVQSLQFTGSIYKRRQWHLGQ